LGSSVKENGASRKIRAHGRLTAKALPGIVGLPNQLCGARSFAAGDLGDQPMRRVEAPPDEPPGYE
jgi:hypothetical protein